MRSVFVLLRDTTEADVAAYLDRTYPSGPRPPWLLRGVVNPYLYIDFYRAFSVDCDPEEYEELTRQFGGKPAVAVQADVSGSITGGEQALDFVTGLLGSFSGAAIDDYSSHLWSLSELLAEYRVSGHRFFDFDGWYIEGQADA